MRIISNYDEFCKLSKIERVLPEIKSNEGAKSVQFLRANGWKIRWWRRAKDILSTCRKSEKDFNFAVRDAGLDLWVINE